MNRGSKEDMEYKAGLEDNFLKHIGYEYTELLCEELDKDKDKIDAISIPESLDDWFINFHKQEHKHKRRSKRRNKALTILRRAAIVILLIFAVNYILVATVEAYRIQFLNTITRIKEKFTQIDLTDDETEEENIPEDWEGRYYPTYIPEGYKLVEKFVNGETPIVVYNNDGGRISFHQMQQKTALRIDTESGEASNVTIGEDKEALYLKKEGSSILTWTSENMMFYINSNILEINTLIRIAESIEVKK